MEDDDRFEQTARYENEMIDAARVLIEEFEYELDDLVSILKGTVG